MMQYAASYPNQVTGLALLDRCEVVNHHLYS